ncbi:MAG: GNAT family N-acetyltransferase [Clostridiales bacterium]|nr:GNAT family N-acetyltransferase [Clostridiales bacterium]
MNFIEVTDNKILTDFYKNCKMEIEDDWVKLMNPIRSIGCIENGKIICAATISKRFNKTILDYIGVDKSLRGKGLGKELLEQILKNENEVYICAKNQGFFKSQGFIETEDSDLIKECLYCPQFNKNCFPRIMKRG